MWLSGWLLHQTGGSVHVAGPIAGVLLAYGASIASVAWRHRKLVTDKNSGLTVAKAAPRGVVQLILVVVTLVVLSAGWLLLVGSMTTVGLRPLTTATVVTLAVLAAVVVFLGGLSDETTLSLHPFYRARVASAFAVRRVRRADGQTVARAYAPEERTVLSEYGALAEDDGVPARRVRGVGHGGGEADGARRPPRSPTRSAPTGSAARTSAMSGHRPHGGRWRRRGCSATSPSRAPSRSAARRSRPRSAVQRTAWYETLLVVTGVRLGAWMPNPAYLIDTYTRPRPWHEPGLPRARRLSYLVRQLFGAHSVTAPLVQVTDGGFYDNLGPGGALPPRRQPHLLHRRVGRQPAGGDHAGPGADPGAAGTGRAAPIWRRAPGPRSPRGGADPLAAGQTRWPASAPGSPSGVSSPAPSTIPRFAARRGQRAFWWWRSRPCGRRCPTRCWPTRQTGGRFPRDSTR